MKIKPLEIEETCQAIILGFAARGNLPRLAKNENLREKMSFNPDFQKTNNKRKKKNQISGITDLLDQEPWPQTTYN